MSHILLQWKRLLFYSLKPIVSVVSAAAAAAADEAFGIS